MTYRERITEHPTYETVPGYWLRHEAAVTGPQGAERPIIHMLRGWLDYADRHRERFESGIGEDYVLGPEWATIGRAIIGLLNGETGRLDCGALDGLIRNVLKAEDLSDDGTPDA